MVNAAPEYLRNMNYTILLKETEDYVTDFFRENPNPNLYYHNLAHTKKVAAAVMQIASYYKLDDHDMFIVCTAAWFHDVGYLVADKAIHEEKSAELAQLFLKSKDVTADDIEEIKKCILATKMPQLPKTLLEEIICDADLYYLGTDQYRKRSKLLKKETDALDNDTTSDNYEWRSLNIHFFEAHQYHTAYCRMLLDKEKANTLTRLKNKQVAIIAGELDDSEPALEEIPGKKKKAPKKKKIKRPVRGIETMFRISAANSVRVSVMADNKAHIMISVNSIIISVVFALLIRNIEDNMHLLIPTIILLLVNIVTIVYGVLATRPKISDGLFTQQQVEEKSVNLLYFGSFFNMNYPEYHVAVNKMMKDAEFLYGSLTKDIYWQGKVLGRKYRLLRISYNIFMYGMILSVLAFAIAAFFFS